MPHLITSFHPETRGEIPENLLVQDTHKHWLTMCIKAMAEVPDYMPGPVPEWWTFANFVRDIGVRQRYDKLHRHDPAKPFGPGNALWWGVAARRKGAALRIPFDGLNLTYQQWAELYGLKATTLQQRHALKGIRPPELFRKPGRELMTPAEFATFRGGYAERFTNDADWLDPNDPRRSPDWQP